MAHFITATITMTAVAALGVLSSAPERQTRRAPQFQAQYMVEQARTWKIQDRTNGQECTASKSDDGKLTMNSACNTITSAAQNITNWRSDDDGISLINEKGEVVLDFAPSKDGITLVSRSLSLSPTK